MQAQRRRPPLAHGSCGAAGLSAASSASTAATTSPLTRPPMDCSGRGHMGRGMREGEGEASGDASGHVR